MPTATRCRCLNCGERFGRARLATADQDRNVRVPLVEHRAHAAIANAFAAVAPHQWVQPCAICGEPPAALPGHLSDLDGVAHEAYALTDTLALLLVRPDGHVAYRGGIADADALAASCRRIAGPSEAGGRSR